MPCSLFLTISLPCPPTPPFYEEVTPEEDFAAHAAERNTSEGGEEEKEKAAAPAVADPQEEEGEEEGNEELDEEDDSLSLDVLVFINRSRKGETFVIINPRATAQDSESGPTGEEVLVDFTPLAPLLKKELADEPYLAEIAFFERSEKFVPCFKTPNGISIEYNEMLQAIAIEIPTEHLRTKVTTLTHRGKRENEELTYPSPWSAYLNVFGEKSLEYLNDSKFVCNHYPSYIGFNFVAHRKLWTLETDFDIGSFNLKNRSWGDVTLTRDWPNDSLRLSLGDVAPYVIGYQIGVPLLGFSIDKDPSLFSVITQESDKFLDFALEKPTKLVIYINDNFIREISLPAGKHKFDNFPFALGPNRVVIKIKNGPEEEPFMSFDYFYSYSALPQGQYVYSWGMGFPQSSWGNASYDWNLPLFTSSLLYGASPNWTCGGYFQISPRQCQLGTENILTSPRFKTTFSYGLFWPFGRNPAWQAIAMWEYSPPEEKIDPVTWSASIEYSGAGIDFEFSSRRSSNMGRHRRSGYIQLLASYNFYKKIFTHYSSSASFECAFNEKWRPSYYFSGSLSRTYNQYLSLSLSGFWNLNQRRSSHDYGILFSINTALPSANIYNRTSYCTDRESLCHQSYYNNQLSGNNSISASAGYENNQRQNIYNGSFGYLGTYLQSAAFTSVVEMPGNRRHRTSRQGNLNIALGTAIAYADGKFAISRPIPDSFIIIAPEEGLRDSGIEVNPLSGDNYLTKSWGRLPAILSNASSYSEIPVTISSENAPLGYVLGKTNYICQTAYKSGTTIKVGEGYFILAEGRLLDKNGEPIKCTFGTAKRIGATAEISFFTNREGYFQIEGLKEGSYELTLYGKKQGTTTLSIEMGEDDICDVGDVQLE